MGFEDETMTRSFKKFDANSLKLKVIKIEDVPTIQEHKRELRKNLEGVVDLNVVDRFFLTPYYESYSGNPDCPPVMRLLQYTGMAGGISGRKRDKLDLHFYRCEECAEVTAEIQKLADYHKEHPVSEEYIDACVARSIREGRRS